MGTVVQASGTGLHDPAPSGQGTIGQALLEPTVIYVPRILSLAEAVPVKVRHPLSLTQPLRDARQLGTSTLAAALPVALPSWPMLDKDTMSV